MTESKASTIVGDPQHDGETGGMSDLAKDFGQDDVDLDPQSIACPDCGVDAGEPCEYYGGRGAGEERGAPHGARWRDCVGGSDE